MRGFKNLKRRLNFILTSLSLRSKGFYTPFDYLREMSWTPEPYPEVMALFQERRPVFEGFLRHIGCNAGHFRRIDAEPGNPSFRSPFLSRLDAAVVYSGITRFQPRRIVEIGSGNTTHFMARAVSDHGLDCDIVCIDPKPRISISDLPVRFVRRVFAASDLPMIAELTENDVLFIDSSHILQQGFDVDILLNRAFPRLRRGVVVHVHDIFLPFGYPDEWQDFRFNEQQALIPWLLSGTFETEFASHYAWREMKSDLSSLCPDFTLDTPDNGGSIWLRKL